MDGAFMNMRKDLTRHDKSDIYMCSDEEAKEAFSKVCELAPDNLLKRHFVAMARESPGL